MVDPLEAILAYVGRDADIKALIGTRIAGRHRYGLAAGGWGQGGEAGATGLAITPVPGVRPDLDAGMWRLRLDARAYGATAQRALAVGLALRDLCDRHERTTVLLPSGLTALIYFIVLDDSPEGAFDTDIRMDYVRLPLRAGVAAQEV